MPRKKKPPKLPECVRRHGAGFRVVLSVDGVRHRSRTLPTEEAAVAWRDSYRESMGSGIDRPLELTLAGGLRLILEDLEATGGREATVAYYRNHARILFAGLGGEHVPVHTITAADLRRYIDKRRKDGIAAQTITGKELFVLRRIRKLALDAGYALPTDPFVGLRLPKGRSGRFDVLTRERIAELVATIRASGKRQAQHHADIVELMFGTGLRRAEVGRLRVVDIDFDARRIAVDGKTGHRYQPFGDALEPVLRRLVAAAKNGRIVTSWRTVEKLFEAWQKRLGEPRFSPHVMRHSYATEMASRVGPYELMALMGHASLTQTSRYYHGRGDAVRDALNTLRLDPPTREPSE